MRRLLPLCLIAAAFPAATQTPPQSPEKQELYRQLDAIRAAARADDWNEAWRRSIVLDASLAHSVPVFGRVRILWTGSRGKLAEWIALIRAGLNDSISCKDAGSNGHCEFWRG